MKPGMSALDAPTQIVLRGRRPDVPSDHRRAAPVQADPADRRTPRDAVATAASLPSRAGAAAGQRPGTTAGDREIPLKRIALVLGAVALAGTLVLAASLAMAGDANYSSTRSMPPAFAFAT